MNHLDSLAEIVEVEENAQMVESLFNRVEEPRQEKLRVLLKGYIKPLMNFKQRQRKLEIQSYNFNKLDHIDN